MSNKDIEVRNENQRYQERMLKLRKKYEENMGNYKFTPGHGLSADEAKAYIRHRLKEAKWITKGSATVNDAILWAVMTLLALSAGGLIYIGYLIIQVSG